MDFGVFARSLKKSAALAAEAAQKLDFDQMAAKDEYIHTDEVPDQRRKFPKTESAPMDDTSTLSTHSSLLDRTRNMPMPFPADSATSTATRSGTRNLVPLKVDVPDRLPRVRQDSLSSEDEDDPILSLIRKDNNPNKNVDSVGLQSTRNNTNTAKEIQKHRFFEDLENRIAQPEKELPDDIPSETTKAKNTGSPQPEASTAPNLPPWLSAAASALRFKRPKDSSATIPSRPAFFRQKVEPPKEEDDFANVAVVSGAAVLGDAELEELAAFGKSQNYLTVLVEVVKHHPREIFILFTLCLGAFVYLFSKNRSWGV